MISYEFILKKYKHLEGEELLKPLINDVFQDRIALVSSFGTESAVLLHMISKINPNTKVIFLNTGHLFAETLNYKKLIVKELGLKNIVEINPSKNDLKVNGDNGQLWNNNPNLCCHIRKVIPLEKALQGLHAWINGRKRHHGSNREALENLETVDWRLKINPLINWNAQNIDDYFNRYGLTKHPLLTEGYMSVGCLPCTNKSIPGGSHRSGRWLGSEKTECGIHWSANGKPIRS